MATAITYGKGNKLNWLISQNILAIIEHYNTDQYRYNVTSILRPHTGLGKGNINTYYFSQWEMIWD